jgi:hypothetical protein
MQSNLVELDPGDAHEALRRQTIAENKRKVAELFGTSNPSR